MKRTLYPFPDKFDALSKHGASLLVDAIQSYWRARGFWVQAERFAIEGTASWGVRSNLVAGLPRGAGRRF